MDRREFLTGGVSALAGCGSDMEYQIQPSPNKLRSSKQTFIYGIEQKWVPVLTFDTPGNLSVTYTTQLGESRISGRLIEIWFDVVTSSFTHTTAAGLAKITGLPRVVASTAYLPSMVYPGTMIWRGFTTTAVELVPGVSPGFSEMNFYGPVSGGATQIMDTSNLLTGSLVEIYGHLSYFTDES